MSRLDGRVVLVTGAGAGLGRAIAQTCAEAGALVVVAAPGENGAATADSIVAAGGTARWIRTDVTSDGNVTASVDEAATAYGGIDAVVHSATSRASSQVHTIDTLTATEWDDHVAVSIRGAFLLARAAFPHLRARGGRFVVMTSPSGMEGSTALPAYAAMKGAMRGFAKSLAVEWGADGITVNAVSPLSMTSALQRAYESNPALEARLRAAVPLGRIGDPLLDVAPAVVALLGDPGRYITGQTIVVDGGRYTSL